jgi:steroid delta-isomerase-like uncharacterized protein
VAARRGGLRYQIELRCLPEKASMGISTAIASVDDVRAFIDEYFEAWSGTDEGLILSYYSENVALELPSTVINGKAALRDQFVRPFVAGFPGNRHVVKNMIFGKDVVVVEWSFESAHKGPFLGTLATGTAVKLPGCGVYQFDPLKRQITAARIYFDVTTLLKQISSQQPQILQNLLISWFAARGYPKTTTAA